MKNIASTNSEEGILRKLGIKSLSDMQLEMKEAMLGGGRAVVLLSPTGSGKTLAYLLPLTNMVDAALPYVQAVVIVPGPELALQSHGVLKGMACVVRSMCLYGGRPAMDVPREMRRAMPQAVLANPGRSVVDLE